MEAKILLALSMALSHLYPSSAFQNTHYCVFSDKLKSSSLALPFLMKIEAKLFLLVLS
tara:strand:- start:317 stop:490 length:174 start_codon:yes stop_codon:yes gene_type:complete